MPGRAPHRPVVGLEPRRLGRRGGRGGSRSVPSVVGDEQLVRLERAWTTSRRPRPATATGPVPDSTPSSSIQSPSACSPPQMPSTVARRGSRPSMRIGEARSPAARRGRRPWPSCPAARRGAGRRAARRSTRRSARRRRARPAAARGRWRWRAGASATTATSRTAAGGTSTARAGRGCPPRRGGARRATASTPSTGRPPARSSGARSKTAGSPRSLLTTTPRRQAAEVGREHGEGPGDRGIHAAAVDVGDEQRGEVRPRAASGRLAMSRSSRLSSAQDPAPSATTTSNRRAPRDRRASRATSSGGRQPAASVRPDGDARAATTWARPLAGGLEQHRVHSPPPARPRRRGPGRTGPARSRRRRR